MQDDYNRFIRHSMRQAQCDYEDIFASDVLTEQSESPCCGEKGNMRNKAVCGSEDRTETQAACSGCEKKRCPEATLPVMVFIEPQTFGRMYNEAEALRQGTLFPVLDKPFLGGGCHC